ncbi:uncharacterized protein EI97DRAFT_438121 [Westerdykella ornata]|uniref:Uncharacterized protein n=1 Tax=Westerdykella ornata TaxID=318751 RepID=A0A6A6K000_WESOR|nr:uncharacterized protein EI97DRAFT_438121 [Westerdykella ornata]KAF2280659.1 hypothetical protein EI97DRAFT_438121 [Westerdykella ornata]
MTEYATFATYLALSRSEADHRVKADILVGVQLQRSIEGTVDGVHRIGPFRHDPTGEDRVAGYHQKCSQQDLTEYAEFDLQSKCNQVRTEYGRDELLEDRNRRERFRFNDPLTVHG